MGGVYTLFCRHVRRLPVARWWSTGPRLGGDRSGWSAAGRLRRRRGSSGKDVHWSSWSASSWDVHTGTGRVRLDAVTTKGKESTSTTPRNLRGSKGRALLTTLPCVDHRSTGHKYVCLSSHWNRMLWGANLTWALEGLTTGSVPMLAVLLCANI